MDILINALIGAGVSLIGFAFGYYAGRTHQ